MTTALEILYYNQQEWQGKKAVTQSSPTLLSYMEEEEPDITTLQHWGLSALTAG